MSGKDELAHGTVYSLDDTLQVREADNRTPTMRRITPRLGAPTPSCSALLVRVATRNKARLMTGMRPPGDELIRNKSHSKLRRMFLLPYGENHTVKAYHPRSISRPATLSLSDFKAETMVSIYS